jgi:hypothetical protein
LFTIVLLLYYAVALVVYGLVASVAAVVGVLERYIYAGAIFMLVFTLSNMLLLLTDTCYLMSSVEGPKYSRGVVDTSSTGTARLAFHLD